MYQTILFDLDGTLSRSEEGIINCVQYALESFGIASEREKLTSFIGPPLKDSFMREFGMTEEQAARAQRKYRERYSTIGILENEIYPGVEEMVRALKAAGRRLAVATSKPTPFSRRIIESYGLTDCFELVLGSEFDGRRHSKAEVIHDVLEELGVPEEEKTGTVMVGDRDYDVLGARACGLGCVGVSFGYAEPGELERAGAVYVAPTAEALLDWLLKN